MAIKKSEIYGQIWAACDKLRGGVEPARYKDYILTLLFVKYVSDRYKSSDNWDIEVPEGGSFDDIVALKYKKNIGEGINIVISKFEGLYFTYNANKDLEQDCLNCVKAAYDRYGRVAIFASWMSLNEIGDGSQSGILLMAPYRADIFMRTSINIIGKTISMYRYFSDQNTIDYVSSVSLA